MIKINELLNNAKEELTWELEINTDILKDLKQETDLKKQDHCHIDYRSSRKCNIGYILGHIEECLEAELKNIDYPLFNYTLEATVDELFITLEEQEDWLLEAQEKPADEQDEEWIDLLSDRVEVIEETREGLLDILKG